MRPLLTGLLTALMIISLACGYSSKTTPPQAGTVPAIAQLMPNSAISGGSTFTLTVIGGNFATNAVVNWNGGPQTTTFLSATQVTATIPASAIASPATVHVTVTNPGRAPTGQYGGGTLSETSANANFLVN